MPFLKSRLNVCLCFGVDTPERACPARSLRDCRSTSFPRHRGILARTPPPPERPFGVPGAAATLLALPRCPPVEPGRRPLSQLPNSAQSSVGGVDALRRVQFRVTSGFLAHIQHLKCHVRHEVDAFPSFREICF